MVRIVSVEKCQIRINRQEVLRYLGYGRNLPDAGSAAWIEETIAEIESCMDCRACCAKFPLALHPEGLIELGKLRIRSRSLARNLQGCDAAILFVATIGHAVDRAIRKYGVTSPAKGSVAQAAGAAAVEVWCDFLCDRFAREERVEGNFLRPRFSPGYGDLPLELQGEILPLLDSGRIGVCLTEGMLMLPSKSVSAIVGVGRARPTRIASGCAACAKSNCPYRGGTNCEIA